MPETLRPLHNVLHRWPRHHAFRPPLNMRPVLDVDAKETEHPGHGKGKVGEICYCWAIFERYVPLVWLGEAFFEDVPLFQGICMESGGGRFIF